MDILSIQGLQKRYESFELKDVSFHVDKGRIMGFIGRNGAGKSTTLKSLLNFVHPDAGEIRFFGQSFKENEFEIKRRIGFVTGGVDYYTKKKLSVITNVTRRFYPNWDEQAYRRYMGMFALKENKTPAELSAGMKVKYALTLALSHRADLLILDEPTSGLDPISRDDLLDVFLNLVDEGVSILFSTHITSDLDKCADDITYIQNGQIVTSEPIEQFVNRYRVVTLLENRPDGRLIGLKRAKHGYTALVKAGEGTPLGLTEEAADLETIMVHMEKEDA